MVESTQRAIVLLLLGLFTTCSASSQAEEEPLFHLDKAGLEAVEHLDLYGQHWRYWGGAEDGLARPGIDDSQWSLVLPRIFPGEAMPEPWTGVGWFRLHFTVGEDLVGIPLTLRLYQTGASEVYLNGELLVQHGQLGIGDSPFVAERWSESTVFSLKTPGEHLLAVRYAQPRGKAFHRIDWLAGFVPRVGLANRVVGAEVAFARETSFHKWLFTGVFLAFAVLHLLLYAFLPRYVENLHFATFCVASASLAFLLFNNELLTDPRVLLVSYRLLSLSGLLFGASALRFVYGVFEEGGPRRFRWYLGMAFLVAIWNLPTPSGMPLQCVFLLMLWACGEMIWLVGRALRRKKPGARILGLGILSLALGFGAGLLANLGLLPADGTIKLLVPFFSVMGLLTAMSTYLARRFAETHRALHEKLEEVEKLSREKLEQERRARREEVERKLLEAEYERKVVELEEARELQLSMLPKRIPQLPDLEIAAHMTTATEVGGDYYDFDLAEDGTLTLAIGDATGHGMRAGTMVTATKTLFNALAPELDLLPTLRRSSMALKRLNLRKLAMALTLTQYKDGRLRVAAAGMPPVYLYRAATGEVESVLLAGMPLGSLAGFPYKESALKLEAHDTVFLLSDGFPERLNPAGELFGYERMAKLFAEIGGEEPSVVIERLVAAGECWAEGVPTDDDITFVVMRAVPG